MSEPTAIRPKERDAIMQALSSGVVPRVGQRHIQVGRAGELGALIGDIDRIADGGSSFRLIIGDYGAGKSFFLSLVKAVALEKKLVATSADLSPEKRLFATGGQAVALYRELVSNLSTRSRPDGGALPAIVERFVATSSSEAASSEVAVQEVIARKLTALTEFVGGYDFAAVVGAYARGHESGDEQLKSDAIRWLRGEFATKTDARAALGVRTIVEDSTVLDHLKLLAGFIRQAGFSGLMVVIDEMVNLYKLAHGQSRTSNYEQILRVLNDTLGSAEGIGYVMGGTPDFLYDPRKGLYSYAALQTRLAENPYAVDGVVDFTGPVVKLECLSPEDLFLLMVNIRTVVLSGPSASHVEFPDEAIEAFMKHCSERIGSAYFQTPRNVIKSFVSLLAVLEQNPTIAWGDLVGSVEIEDDPGEDLNSESTADAGEDDNLVTFSL